MNATKLILKPTPDECLAVSEITLFPSRLAEALAGVTGIEWREIDGTAWFDMCVDTHEASVFFKSQRKFNASKRTTCRFVAEVFLDVISVPEVPIITPKFVGEINGVANWLRVNLPSPSYLPPKATTNGFNGGLQALCEWCPPVTAPKSRSGSPLRRSSTLILARKFADAFDHIPVDYIHYFVTLAWPGTNASTTWRLLNKVTTDLIKKEAAEFRRLEQAAQMDTQLVMYKAGATRSPSSEQKNEIENLQQQVARLSAGQRRFTTDAAKLRALRDLADSIDEIGLRDEMIHFIDNALSDYTK